MEGHFRHSSVCIDSGSDEEREYMKRQLRREIDLDMAVQSMKGRADVLGTLGARGGGYRDARARRGDARKHEGGDEDEVKGVLVRNWDYTQKEADYFAKLYSIYFEAVMGVAVNFYFTWTSCIYVSTLEACRARDAAIVNLITHRPVIWDVMGGSGTDSVGFLCNLYPQELTVVDYCYTDIHDELTREFEAVKKNLTGVKDAFESLSDVTINFHCSKASDFLSLPANAGKQVDIVFIDPNWWSEKPEDKTEMSPEELLEVLHFEVFEPIKENSITVDFYILKTRWPWEKIADVVKDSDLTNNYHPVVSLLAQPFREKVNKKQWESQKAVKGIYHYIVLMRSTLRDEAWVKSELYSKILTSESITVDTRNYEKPFKPRYDELIKFPVWEDPEQIPRQYRRTIHMPDRPGSKREMERKTYGDGDGRGVLRRARQHGDNEGAKTRESNPWEAQDNEGGRASPDEDGDGGGWQTVRTHVKSKKRSQAKGPK